MSVHLYTQLRPKQIPRQNSLPYAGKPAIKMFAPCRLSFVYHEKWMEAEDSHALSLSMSWGLREHGHGRFLICT